MSDKSTRNDIDEIDYDPEFEGDGRLESSEEADYDWESVDWNESVDDFEDSSERGRDWSPAGMNPEDGATTTPASIPRHPDRLKVLAATSLVILAFITMLSLFFWATMYLILFFSDTSWVEGWMMFMSGIVAVIVSGILWVFVKNSVDRA